MITIGWPELFGKYADGPPDEPYFMAINMTDIPETVYKAIKNSPPNCMGLTVNWNAGWKTREAARKATKEMGMVLKFTIVHADRIEEVKGV